MNTANKRYRYSYHVCHDARQKVLRLLLTSWCCMVSGGVGAQSSDEAQWVHNTVYVCEKNGVVSLGNTSPISADRACTRKTMSTRLAADTLRSPPTTARLSNAVPHYPRAWNDPQPTAQTLILGAQVPANIQWQRDQGRRRILLSELNAAEQRLQALNAQYNEGQPERQGNEKNYQKYLDRVAALQQDIRLTQANIAALQRELNTVGGAP